MRRGPGHGGATTAVRANTLQFLERGGLPLLLVLLIAFFAIDPASGSVFRSAANVRNILGNQAVTAIVALAMVVPLAAGIFEMPYLKFQLANFTSAFVWAGAVLGPGAFGMKYLF